MTCRASQRSIIGGRRERGYRASSTTSRTGCHQHRTISIVINIPSQADFSLSTTKVPFRPDRLESQIPVEDAYPTQDPARFIRGAAHERHWDVEGPVHVSQAGEHLDISSDANRDIPGASGR